MHSFDKIFFNYKFWILIAIVEAVLFVIVLACLYFRRRNRKSNKSTEESSANNVISKLELQIKRLTFDNAQLQKIIGRYEKGSRNPNYTSAKSYQGHVAWDKNTLSESVPNAISESKKGAERLQNYGGATYYSMPNGDGSERTEINFDTANAFPKPDASIPKYEYLQGINNGKFIKIVPTGEKSYFKTWIEYGIRKFEFDGNIQNALANFNATFDKICEIEGKRNGATKIINVEPGILDNNLKVTTPAKIKLA